MRWTEADYLKHLASTRDHWLSQLKNGTTLFNADEASTPLWLSHVQAIFEFEHPLNVKLGKMASNMVASGDAVYKHNLKLKSYSTDPDLVQPVLKTIHSLIPFMLETKQTWPHIHLHIDRDGDTHFLYSKPESVIPIIHVKKLGKSSTYEVLDCTCKNLNNSLDINISILQEIEKQSIPLDTAWVQQLYALQDMQLLNVPNQSTRHDQLWIRSVKNYAEQVHVEMVRSPHFYDGWFQQMSKYGDDNVIMTVLAAMELVRNKDYYPTPKVEQKVSVDLGI